MTSRTIRARLTGVPLVVLVVMTAPDPARAQQQVPADCQGEWVAASAACTAPARVRIAAASITLVNAADKESLGPVEMAGPGFFPPDYNGIQQVAIADLGGDQPVTVTFNYQQKRGVALADMALPCPESGCQRR